MNKQHEIVKKTAFIIHSKGYEQTSVKDVLETCDIGKGQFYHYFKSKEDLGLQVLDYVYDKWKSKLFDKILLGNLPPNEKLVQMYEWVEEIQNKTQLKHGCFFGNLGVEMSPHNEHFRIKVKAIFDQWIYNLSEVLKELDLEKKFTEEAIMETSVSVVLTIEGGIMLTKVNQDIKYLKNAFKTCQSTIEGLLFGGKNERFT